MRFLDKKKKFIYNNIYGDRHQRKGGSNMICRQCGTESNGLRCSYCGAALSQDASEETVELSAYTPPPEPRRVQEIPRVKKISSGRLFFAALMLLVPLVYLFIDTFVCLAKPLFEFSNGERTLSVLIERIFSFEYALNSYHEIEIATLGEDIDALSFYSVRTLANAGDLLPAVCVLLGCVLLSALAGVLLLFFGKRLLRSRLRTDLVLFFGAAGAFAPLAGVIVLRLLLLAKGGFSGADLAMYRVMISVESLITLGICACVVLPALSVIRRAASGERDELVHVGLLGCVIGGRSFGFAKLLAFLSVLLTVALGVSFLIAPIFLQGEVPMVADAIAAIRADGAAFFDSLMALFDGEGGEMNFALAVSVVLNAAWLLLWGLLGLFALCAIPSLFRILRADKHTLCTKKRASRSLKCTQDRTRRIVLLPFLLTVLFQMFLLIFLAIASRFLVHFDLTAVGESLEMIYSFVAYIRMCCGTNTLYVLLAIGGFALCGIAKHYANKLILLSQKDG